ncbi:MAG: PilN domain-containing protein [Dehalococcoidales bacterium]|nr:PilN domain-containing protein [Dehalococcoidales bacterium]
MAKKIITLYIDDSSLRLMVTRGERIKEWAYFPLENGLIKNNVVTDEAELAARIRQLFKLHKIRKRKVIIGLSGLHCLSRPIILPQLPKEMLDEAVKREARRVLPMSLEQLYLSWQVIPSTGEQLQVFLVALPRLTVDVLVKTLNQAGLEPSFIGVKPLLLTRTIKETTAISIDVQFTEFDIVVTVNGVPRTIRTVVFPHEGLSLEKKTDIINRELQRALTFYSTNYADDPLAPDVPIFISGELADDLNLFQVFAEAAGRTVLPVQSQFECPGGFNSNMYLVNMGLALHQLHRRSQDASIVSLNSLPVNYQTKPVSLTNVMALPGNVVAVALLLLFIMMNRNATAAIDSTQVRMNTAGQALEQRLSQVKEISGEIDVINNQIKATETAYDKLEAALDSIKRQNFRINGDLSVTVKSLPATIALSSIKHSGNALSISGIAQSKDDVLLYISKMESSNMFGEIIISSLSKVQGKGMNFTLLVNPEKSGEGIFVIEVILRYLPVDITLTNLRQVNDTMTVDGRAPDEDSIVLYLQALEESNAFRGINLSSKTDAADGGINFTFVARTLE